MGTKNLSGKFLKEVFIATLSLMLLADIYGIGRCNAAEASSADYFDLQGFINSELKKGVKKIVIPAGKYRVKPVNRQHLLLQNLKDVEIVADGVRMICTQTTRALTVRRCTNVVIRGLMIDYDPLPFTQGKIVAISSDKKVHEIELFDGYPPAERVQNFKYEIFKPDTLTLRSEDHYPEKIEIINSKTIRVINPSGSPSDPERVGDLIVIGAEYAPDGSSAHTIECSESKNVKFEGIIVYASNCFAFLENNCDGNVYSRCIVDRCPEKEEIAKRAYPRLRSANADAFHSVRAIKGPSYIGCIARYMGDDAINIHGDYHFITEVNGSELRVLSKGSFDIKAGDTVEIVSYEGRVLPPRKVVSIQPDGKINEAERNFLLKQRMDKNIKSKMLNDAYLVSLDSEVAITMGSIICSIARKGNGFVVRDCDFGFNRSRGILIKASDGQIIGNKLTENWGPAILVSPEFWWLESGVSSNLIIRNNVISECKATPIVIEAYGGAGLISGKPAFTGAHKNITIANNSITDNKTPSIRLTSVDTVKVQNNIFKMASSSTTNLTVDNLIKIQNCTNYVITNNSIEYISAK